MCASGLQAFNFAAMEVMTGQNDVVIAGGVEVMSRVPLGSDAGALSPKLLEKYEIVQQGISADLVADKYKVTREQMDEFSLWSHRKAIRPASRWTNSRSGPTARRSGRSMKVASRRRSNPSLSSTRVAISGCSTR